MAEFYQYGGTSGGTYASYFTGKLSVWENSYDIGSNSSNVGYRLELISGGSGRFSGYGASYSVTINGSTVNSGSGTYSSMSYYTAQTICEGSTTVYHNPDGSATIYCSAALDFASGSYSPGDFYPGGYVTLTTIPRASSVTCNSFNIGDSTTISINRASSSFTHTLTWQFGNASGTIATKTGSTSVGWTPNASTLYQQIPSATSGWGSITCITYNGNTEIGRSTCNFTAYAVSNNCRPNVSIAVTDTNSTTRALTTSSSVLVKGFSTASVAITGSMPISGDTAYIRSYTTQTGDGKTSTSNTPSFPAINSNTITTTALDTRGYSNSATVTKTGSDWIPYEFLNFTSLTIERAESTADTVTLNLTANYFNDTFGVVSNEMDSNGYITLPNSSQVPLLQYRFKENGGSFGSWIVLIPTLQDNTLSYTEVLAKNHQNEYTFEFKLMDNLMTVTQQYILTKGIPIIRVKKDAVEINGDLRVKDKVAIGQPYDDEEGGSLQVDGKNITEKDMITIGLQDTLFCTILNQYTKLTGWQQRSKTGNKLLLSNNEIVIGQGVSKIKISGKFTWYSTTGSIKYIWINKNNSGVIWSTIDTSNNTYRTDAISDFLLDVQEGDKISARYYTAYANDALENNNRTYMSVEVVE